jgi:hypothetical protein
MVQMDETTEQFIADLILKEHNRLIAAVLGGIESLTGQKDAHTSKVVKDVANMSKRVMFTQLTRTEVESKHVNRSD